MNTPFVYGKLPQEIDFTDREREIVRLKNNFNSLINTVIISPRRWGKTSLVKMAALSAIRENRKLKIVHLDIFNIRSEYEFPRRLSSPRSPRAGSHQLTPPCML